LRFGSSASFSWPRDSLSCEIQRESGCGNPARARKRLSYAAKEPFTRSPRRCGPAALLAHRGTLAVCGWTGFGAANGTGHARSIAAARRRVKQISDSLAARANPVPGDSRGGLLIQLLLRVRCADCRRNRVAGAHHERIADLGLPAASPRRLTGHDEPVPFASPKPLHLQTARVPRCATNAAGPHRRGDRVKGSFAARDMRFLQGQGCHARFRAEFGRRTSRQAKETTRMTQTSSLQLVPAPR
jgi:hypothetical protein